MYNFSIFGGSEKRYHVFLSSFLLMNIGFSFSQLLWLVSIFDKNTRLDYFVISYIKHCYWEENLVFSERVKEFLWSDSEVKFQDGALVGVADYYCQQRLQDKFSKAEGFWGQGLFTRFFLHFPKNFENFLSVLTCFFLEH